MTGGSDQPTSIGFPFDVQTLHGLGAISGGPL
jgi:hypothetical protein